MSLFSESGSQDWNLRVRMPLALKLGAGTNRRAGNAEVMRIQQDPRLTSKP
jgi:hypothetical protein